MQITKTNHEEESSERSAFDRFDGFAGSKFICSHLIVLINNLVNNRVQKFTEKAGSTGSDQHKSMGINPIGIKSYQHRILST